MRAAVRGEEDETIDAATLEKEIHWLYDCGADGVVMAMVSEILRLSGEERRQLAELACRFGRDRGNEPPLTERTYGNANLAQQVATDVVEAHATFDRVRDAEGAEGGAYVHRRQRNEHPRHRKHAHQRDHGRHISHVARKAACFGRYRRRHLGGFRAVLRVAGGKSVPRFFNLCRSVKRY